MGWKGFPLLPAVCPAFGADGLITQAEAEEALRMAIKYKIFMEDGDLIKFTKPFLDNFRSAIKDPRIQAMEEPVDSAIILAAVRTSHLGINKTHVIPLLSVITSQIDLLMERIGLKSD